MTRETAWDRGEESAPITFRRSASLVRYQREFTAARLATRAMRAANIIPTYREGRSYQVFAPNPVVARMLAREMARLDGHRNPKGSILHMERTGPDSFEVVIEEGIAR